MQTDLRRTASAVTLPALPPPSADDLKHRDEVRRIEAHMRAIVKLGRTLCILALAALAAPHAHAGDWRPDFIVEESAFQALHVVDTLQSLDGAEHPDRFRESTGALDAGWCIGAHPSRAQMVGYMTGEALLHLGVTALLVRYTRPAFVRAWEAITLSIDGSIVAHNASVGVRVHI